jgi:hypothetical protein
MNIREWEKLKYHDLEKILPGLRKIEQNYPLHKFPFKTASLWSRELRQYGESHVTPILSSTAI